MRKNEGLWRKKEDRNARRQKKRWLAVVTCLACMVVFCTVYALILPAIALEREESGESGEATLFSASAQEESEYDTPERFYLWLKLRDVNGNINDTAIYGSSEWDEEKGLTDALRQVENGETFYLIPVSYFIEHYQAYGYTFEPSAATVCPFVYAPNAYYSTDNLAAASYVYVPGQAKEGDEISGWYVRVQDTGTYDGPPRSNIYYTYYNTQEVSTFRLWQFARKSGENVYTKVGNYDDAGALANPLTDVLRVRSLSNEDTKYYLIPIQYFIENYESYGYTFDPASAGSCPFLYAPDASSPTGNLTAAAYVQVNGDWYVRVQDTGTYGNPPRSNVYYSAPASAVSDTVSPSGTVINLFDYWVTAEREDDITTLQENYTRGINAGHALKFKPTGLSGANTWTESEDVYENIVANTLGADGYPALSGQEIFGDENGSLAASSESLAYLFDPSYSGESGAYRNAYRNVTGLLQMDENGYYYYDSTKNYAEFDKDTNHFTLYDDWAVTYTPNNQNTTYGQFFPFDAYHTVSRTSTANDENLNHYFGMTLTARFMQRYGGHIDASKNTDMVFNFSGDDDVWIFIDGVLVADLGGIHDAASVGIDFSTGNVVVNQDTSYEKVTTIKEAFINAGMASEIDTEWWNGNTFADETYHTLRFYYLERGSFASNLRLTYNLTDYPPTSIYKVDQYGEDVEGAGFAVYAADEDYNILFEKGGSQAVLTEGGYTYAANGDIISRTEADADGNPKVLARALYTGTTNAGGEMVFMDEDDGPYTLTELQSMFGSRFVLKEIVVPDGYRIVNDTIKLRIYGNRVMLCDNTYDSGVHSSASLQVVAPSTLKKVNGDTVEYVGENSRVNGTLFAVVLKYIGERDADGNAAALTKQSSWAPVYGTARDGFSITDVSSEKYQDDFVLAAIETAKLYGESKNVFELSESGQMLAQINGMPGDISNYYYMLTNSDKDKTQYTVAYYWSSAGSLEEADSGNTVRIDADAEGYSFGRAFGATISVPNLVNRLVVQKLDSAGSLVSGAQFALYRVEEAAGDENTAGTIYYTADGEAGPRIYLYPDDGRSGEGETRDEAAGDNRGIAKLENGGIGTYEIITDGSSGLAAGKVRAEIDGIVYTITPAETEITRPAEDEENTVKEDGTASFINLQNGSYYLREIAAPAGYVLNPAEVMVLVDDTAVYANAGNAYDGVTVARGPGYVVSTLDQFASYGEIDNTLSWVYEQLLISGESTSFADVYDALNENGGWTYLKSYTGSGYSAETTTTADQSEALTTHLVYDKGGENTLFNYTVNEGWYPNGDTSGVTRRLYTSVGWSYYLLYQDYEYGVEHHGAANYTDLEGAEISNLFSRSTFVQITDENAPGSLEISKKVENAGNTPDTTAFTFTVELKHPAGSVLTGAYKYTVWNVDSEGNRTEAVNGDGEAITGTISYDETTGVCSGIITLTSGQTVVIEEIPYAARYRVIETQNTRYSTRAVRDKGKEAIEGIADTGEADFAGNTVTGTLYWKMVDGELDHTSTVDYVNTYLNNLVIWKEDASDSNKTLAGAEFTLTKTENGKTLYFTGDTENVWSESRAALTTNEFGYIVLGQLGDGTYSLEEVKAPDGYYLLEDAVSVKAAEGKFEVISDNKDMVSVSDEGMSLIVKNTTGYELPKTGGTGMKLFIISGLLLMAGAAGCGYRLRRRL